MADAPSILKHDRGILAAPVPGVTFVRLAALDEIRSRDCFQPYGAVSMVPGPADAADDGAINPVATLTMNDYIERAGRTSGVLDFTQTALGWI